MKRFTLGIVLVGFGFGLGLGLGLLGGCTKPAPDKVSKRPWPSDDYQRADRAVPDSPLRQTVFGITASEKVPYQQLAKKAALVGVELLSVQDSRGEIHLQVTVVHSRRPFVLRLQQGRNKPKLEMGREGTVHVFESRSVSVRSWGAQRIPKGAGVKDVRLLLEGDLAHPIAFKAWSGQKQQVRWPAKGGLSRFPLFFALIFRLDNEQTLVRIGGLNKRGRETASRFLRLKSTDVTQESLVEMFSAAAEHRDPKGLAILP